MRTPLRDTPVSLPSYLAVLLLASLFVLHAGPALAAGGDFSLDFTAAAPQTYNHATGGGAFNDRTVGDTADVVESLEGGDFMCGDIVTYLMAIAVDGTPADALQTIELDFEFSASTTGQPGAALSDITNVAINYGMVSNGAGMGGTDSGIMDDGGSTALLTSESLTGPLFVKNSDLLGTVRIDDLEAGEQVILRIDTRLACQPGSRPTGNLQAGLLDARVISPVEDDISGGKQTIPFKQTGDIVFPQLLIQKTVTTENGTCPGVDELEIRSGDTVRYCYAIANNGTAPALNVTVVDDNGTPGDPNDDFSLTLIGLTDEDGDMAMDDLGAGNTATAEITVQMNLPVGSVVINKATARSDTLMDMDDAQVEVALPPAGGCTIDVTASLDGTCPGVDMVMVRDGDGTKVTWCYKIMNSTSFDLMNVDVDDDIFGDVDTIASIDPLSMATVTAMNVPTMNETHVGSAMGVDPFGNVRDCGTDDAGVKVVSPGIQIDKTVSTNGNCPGADSVTITIGESVTYCYKVTNNGDTVVEDISVDDDKIGHIGNIGSLDPGEMKTFKKGTFQPTDDVTNKGTVTGTDEFGFPVMDMDTAMVDVQAADIEVMKTGTEIVNTQETDQLVYTIMVTNRGELTAENVMLEDLLPEGIDFDTVMTDKGTCMILSDRITCDLGDLAPMEKVTISVEATVNIKFGFVDNEACAETDTPESDETNNCDDFTTRIVPGATRTLGFYKNHPTFVQMCLDVNAGSIDLGFLTIANEVFDNDIDATEGPGKMFPDMDTDVETGQELAIGLMKASPAKYVNGKKRSGLLSARVIAGRQFLVAICNTTLLGADGGLDFDAIRMILAGSSRRDILEIGALLDTFNNSGDILPLGINPGPADPFFPGDDPTDRYD